MNKIIICSKSFEKIVNMLKSCFLCMAMFFDLSKKVLFIECANFC